MNNTLKKLAVIAATVGVIASATASIFFPFGSEIAPGYRSIWKINIDAGPHNVSAISRNGANIDVIVRDCNGNVLNADFSPMSAASVSFGLYYPQTVTVEVINASPVYTFFDGLAQ